MAKHRDSEQHADKSGRDAATRDEYIGRHRERDEVRDDPRGFSVGRGVADQPEHNRNN